jgi:hypothetical protein
MRRPSDKHRVNRRALMSAGVLAAFAAVAAVAQAVGPGSSPSPSAVSSFGALRRPTLPSDPMPTMFNSTHQRTVWQSLNVDPGQSRRLNVAGHDMWLVAGSSNVCLTYQRSDGGPGGVSCGSEASAARDGIVVVDLPDAAGGPTEVLGVLPDGARNLRVNLADGTAITPTMTDGGFWTTATAPVSVGFDGGDGHHDIPMGQPPSAG